MILQEIKKLSNTVHGCVNPTKSVNWVRIKNLLNVHYGDRLKIISPQSVSLECGLYIELCKTAINEIIGYKKWL